MLNRRLSLTHQSLDIFTCAVCAEKNRTLASFSDLAIFLVVMRPPQAHLMTR